MKSKTKLQKRLITVKRVSKISLILFILSLVFLLIILTTEKSPETMSESTKMLMGLLVLLTDIFLFTRIVYWFKIRNVKRKVTQEVSDNPQIKPLDTNLINQLKEFEVKDFPIEPLESSSNFKELGDNLSKIRFNSHMISCSILKDWVGGTLKDNPYYNEMNNFYTTIHQNNFPLEEQIKSGVKGHNCPYRIDELKSLGGFFKDTEWEIDLILKDLIDVINDKTLSRVSNKGIINSEYLKSLKILYITPFSIVTPFYSIERIPTFKSFPGQYTLKTWEIPNSVSGVGISPNLLDKIYKYSYIYYCNKGYINPIEENLLDLNIENRLDNLRTKLSSSSISDKKELMDMNRLINFISEQEKEVLYLIDRLKGNSTSHGLSNQINDFYDLYQMSPDSGLKVNYRYGPGRFQYKSIEEFLESNKELDKVNSNLIDGKFFTDKLLFFENKYFLINHLLNCCDLMIDLSNEKLSNEYINLYLSIEGLNIFESSISKQKLQLLKNLDEKLNEMNHQLVIINSNIVNGFKNVESQLKKLNNKVLYNNILTTINTYQLYSLNKKLKN